MMLIRELDMEGVAMRIVLSLLFACQVSLHLGSGAFASEEAGWHAAEHAGQGQSTQEAAGAVTPAESERLVHNVSIPPDDTGPPWVGLDGYCPVSLVEKHIWIRGTEEFSASHDGLTYHLASEAARTKFLENSERFAPVMSGNDPVIWRDEKRLVPGRREHGVFYRERIYLFSTEESLDKFGRHPDRYAKPRGQAAPVTGSLVHLEPKAGLIEIETSMRVFGVPALSFAFRVNVPADVLRAAEFSDKHPSEPNSSQLR
jgi:YHS domain-containing protein